MFTNLSVNAQTSDDYNVISTAAPFMMIAPDARASAMGDVGVSTSPDVYSMQWNPAKYAFIEEDFSIGLAYSPWLRNLVNDMNIAYLGISKRLSPKSTIAGTLRYFSLGDINYTSQTNQDLGTFSPNEWAFLYRDHIPDIRLTELGKWLLIGLTMLIAGLIQLYCYRHLPIIDFSDWKIKS